MTEGSQTDTAAAAVGAGLRFAAFYGSLRQAVYNAAAPPLDGLGRFVGDCTLRGRLVDHGPYPGFFPDPAGGTVRADLVEILDPAAFFAAFDAWEDYFPEAPERSLYLRRVLAVEGPRPAAWVYVSNLSAADPWVPHGDWARHLRETGKG